MHSYTADQIARNQIEYHTARVSRADRWVIACGGTEQPTRYSDGRWYVYVYNFATGQNGFLGMDDDIVRDTHPDLA
jgi:predicted flavoprotein YhiN